MPNCRYAIVEKVQIESVNLDDALVTFATRADDGDRRSFTVSTANILVDARTSVPLVAGQVGDLYLSREGWAVTSSGHPILGAGNESAMGFKWPECAGAMVYYSPQKVAPLRIRISGKLRGTDTQLSDLEIWNNGETAQAIHWNGAEHIRLALSPGMVDGLSGEVEVWPTKIVVEGRPDSAQDFLLRVDLLDRMLARATQDLVWSPGAKEVTLYLTPEGCATCGVLPEAIVQLEKGTRWPGDSEILDRLNTPGGNLTSEQLQRLDRVRDQLGVRIENVRVAPRRITILGVPEGPEVVQPNDFLDKAFEKVNRPGMREVLRASSIRDIQQHLLRILAPNPGMKISLQLVSHASSGILWLGRYGDAADVSPFYYLDMDPDSLAFLAQFGRSRNLSDVTVVGCDVGSASHVGSAYNGRTLMYTLAELFRCKVVGATDAVHWTEFDERGDYAPDLQVHSGPAGWQWLPDREPQWIPGWPVAPQPLLEAHMSASMSITGVDGVSSHVPGLDQPFELIAPLDVEGTEVRDPALQYLAPEISVTVRPKGSSTDYRADILRGGRLLRLEGSHYRIARGDELYRILLNPAGVVPVRPALPLARQPRENDSTPPPPRRARRFSDAPPVAQ